MAKNENGMKPRDLSESFDITQIFADFFGTTLDDQIIWEFEGKEKSITTGQGDTIIISPGLRGTATNLDTGESIDLVMTGSIIIPADEADTFILNGINVGFGISAPNATPFFAEIRGHFVDVINENGLLEREGNGLTVDLIDELI